MRVQKQNGGNVDVDKNVEEKDDSESVDKYVEHVQVVSLTHCVLIYSLNTTVQYASENFLK